MHFLDSFKYFVPLHYTDLNSNPPFLKNVFNIPEPAIPHVFASGIPFPPDAMSRT